MERWEEELQRSKTPGPGRPGRLAPPPHREGGKSPGRKVGLRGHLCFLRVLEASEMRAQSGELVFPGHTANQQQI